MYETWAHCIVCNITSAEALSDFQVKIEIQGHDSGAGNYITPWDFIAGGDDLRFTDGNSLINIPYWIEAWDDVTKTATIWIKSSLVNGNTRLFMYWGKTSVSPASNGSDTFLFFDDFNGSSLDLTKWDHWSEGSTTHNVGGGHIELYSANGNVNKQSITGKISFPRNVRMEYRFRQSAACYNSSVQMVSTRPENDNVYHNIRGGYSSPSGWGVYVNDVSQHSENITNISAGTWADVELVLATSYQACFQNAESWTHNATMPSETYVPKIYEGSPYDSEYQLDIDYVIVRGYTSAEPTTVVGGECNPFITLQVCYTLGEFVPRDAQVSYHIYRIAEPLDLQTEADIASTDRLQLLQIQLITETSLLVLQELIAKYNIEGYINDDLQVDYDLNRVGLSFDGIYHILNLAPPVDLQKSYCIEGYVHYDVAEVYTIQKAGGWYAKAPIGFSTALQDTLIFHNWGQLFRNWLTESTLAHWTFRTNTLNVEYEWGRLKSWHDYSYFVRLMTETLEAYYNSEFIFYTDDSDFDMDGTHECFIIIPGYPPVIGQCPNGTHEESAAGHYLRLALNHNCWVETSTAETGWSYIFNRGNYLRFQYDAEPKGHGFFAVSMLVAGELNSYLDFEILCDDIVKYRWGPISGLGYVVPNVQDCCNPGDCWACTVEHDHWIVYQWDHNYVAKKAFFKVDRPDWNWTQTNYGRVIVFGSTDNWTGDPDTMSWSYLGVGSRYTDWETEGNEDEKTFRLATMEGCKYIMCKIRTSSRWSEDEGGSFSSYQMNLVTDLQFFKMKKVELPNVPTLDEMKIRMVPNINHTCTCMPWLEVSDIYITRYKDKGEIDSVDYLNFPEINHYDRLVMEDERPHETTGIRVMLDFFNGSYTGWVGPNGTSYPPFYYCEDINPPSGFESAQWVRWKTWLTSTGAYTPSLYQLIIHTRCNKSAMVDLPLLCEPDNALTGGDLSDGNILFSQGTSTTATDPTTGDSWIGRLPLDYLSTPDDLGIRELAPDVVRPHVWMRADLDLIHIPFFTFWDESSVGKIWSGYCVDQNGAHIENPEGCYLTILKEADTQNVLTDTGGFVESTGFFQVIMKSDYSDWEVVLKNTNNDRIFDPGFRKFPADDSVLYADVSGPRDLGFFIVDHEDVCPKSIAHVGSLATY